MSTDPTKPELWHVTNHTGKVRMTISGLITGHLYYFRIFTDCTAGKSGPGELANHIAA
ncbi:MAG: hypothetical protein ABIS37_14235 [Bacteroidia bacterium]